MVQDVIKDKAEIFLASETKLDDTLQVRQRSNLVGFVVFTYVKISYAKLE